MEGTSSRREQPLPTRFLRPMMSAAAMPRKLCVCAGAPRFYPSAAEAKGGRWAQCRRRYGWDITRKARLGRWIESSAVQRLIILLIVVNAVTLGLRDLETGHGDRRRAAQSGFDRTSLAYLSPKSW